MRGGGGGGGKLLLESFLGKVPALSGIRSGAGMDIDCRFGRFRLSGLSNQRTVNSNFVNKWSFQPVQGSHDRSGMHRVRREPVLKEPLNLRKGGEGKQRYQDDSQPRPRQS